MRVDPEAKPWYAGSSLARASAGMPPLLRVYQVMPPEDQGGCRAGDPMVYPVRAVCVTGRLQYCSKPPATRAHRFVAAALWP